MNKLQKIEFIIIITYIITFMIFIRETLKNFIFFDNSVVSNISIFSGMLLVAQTLIFLIVYIIKVVKEKDLSTKLLWCTFPIIAIAFSILFVNGVADSKILVLNIIGVISETIMIILYNLFMLNYYGKNKKMIVTVFLYNIIVLYSSITKNGISYIHHYYIRYLLIAIVVGYIELMVRNRLKLISIVKK